MSERSCPCGDPAPRGAQPCTPEDPCPYARDHTSGIYSPEGIAHFAAMGLRVLDDAEARAMTQVDRSVEHRGEVYCASERAVIAATEAYHRATGDFANPRGLAAAFIAAHDAALGLDRSICLRDLVEAAQKL